MHPRIEMDTNHENTPHARRNRFGLDYFQNTVQLTILKSRLSPFPQGKDFSLYSTQKQRKILDLLSINSDLLDQSANLGQDNFLLHTIAKLTTLSGGLLFEDTKQLQAEARLVGHDLLTRNRDVLVKHALQKEHVRESLLHVIENMSAIGDTNPAFFTTILEVFSQAPQLFTDNPGKRIFSYAVREMLTDAKWEEQNFQTLEKLLVSLTHSSDPAIQALGTEPLIDIMSHYGPLRTLNFSLTGVDVNAIQAIRIYSNTRKIATNIVKSYGLDGEKLARIWEEYDNMFTTLIPTANDPTSNLYFARNFQLLSRLERIQPGIGGELINQRHIHHLTRYSQELLLRQIEEEQKDMNYGVCIFPESDPPHTMYKTFINTDKPENRNAAKLDNFSDELQENGYGLRVEEVSSRAQFIKTMQSLKETYYNTSSHPHKLSFSVMAGHGTITSIQFGEELEKNPAKDLNALDISHLQDPEIAALKDCFEPGATLILLACSGGKPGGIAQEISRVWGIRVIALPDNTNYHAIHTRMDQPDNLDFTVVLASELPYLLPKVYENGELVA